jgi:hypothetical protein
MSAVLKAPKAASAPLHPTLSLVDIGRRISHMNACIAQLGELDPKTSSEEDNKAVSHAQSVAFSELDALRELACCVRPTSPADALVQMGVIFDFLENIQIHELEQREISDLLDKVKRLTAGIMPILARDAGIGIEEVSSEWIAERPAVLWPDVAAVAAGVAGAGA